MRSMSIFVLLLLVATITSAQRDNIPDEYSLRYGETSRQALDIYLPEDADELEGPLPVGLVIHGGGYVAGDKLRVAGFARDMAEQGYTVIVPNYRLATTAPFPAAIEDLTCALAWVHANAADYNFDLARIAVIGESAGGNAAALLGTLDNLDDYLTGCDHPTPGDDWFSAVVAYYPMVELSTCTGDSCLPAQRAAAIYLGMMDFNANAWGEASPLAHIDADDPPFLIIHGDADEVVPVSEAYYLQAALEDAGTPHKLIIIEGARHAFIDELNRPAGASAAQSVYDWLENRWNSVQ